MSNIIHTDDAPAAIGPYSQAVLANDMLFISGQIPVNPSTGIVVEGIVEATHQVMKNLDAILKVADMDFSHVLKSTIYLKDMGDFASMNEVYASYLKEGKYPARETVQVSCLPKNVEVEISMIACKKS